MNPQPFIRGCAFAGTPKVPYPRARPDDAARLPLDTWACAQIPVGVRLEFVGDATEVEIAYETRNDNMGYRGDGAGTTFALWRDGVKRSEERAVLGEGRIRLACEGNGRAVVYLPEGMKPRIADIAGVAGTIEPAPGQPRWVAYGDSILEGWVASGPALSWPAIVAREHRLDVINMGYAGSARGEIASAEQIAELAADVITISHGTNCWTRTPHSAGMMREITSAFLEIVRRGHPGTPILVITPIVRPDAEDTPNGLGATLNDLRNAMEDAAKGLDVISGRELIDASLLGDGQHPTDEGHRTLADKLGPAIAKLVG